VFFSDIHNNAPFFSAGKKLFAPLQHLYRLHRADFFRKRCGERAEEGEQKDQRGQYHPTGTHYSFSPFARHNSKCFPKHIQFYMIQNAPLFARILL